VNSNGTQLIDNNYNNLIKNGFFKNKQIYKYA